MRILAVTGGKGGIGKTTLSINMAAAFAKMKKNVMLLDADLGLANVDVMLGLNPKQTLHDVLLGDCHLEEIFLKGPGNIKIVPASSGITKMADLSIAESANLIHSFSSITDTIDIMVVDMASGISNQVIDFTNASQDILIVICNEPSSLTDSYAVIKILHQKHRRSNFGIIVNKIRNQNEGFQIFEHFQQAVSKFININLNYLGCVPTDDYVSLAAKEQSAAVDKYPHSLFAKAISSICQSILYWQDDQVLAGGIHFFFERLVQNR